MTNIMSGIIRKHFFVTPSIPKEDEDYSVEYSFASEYQGPPLSYDIPRAAPIGIGRIPTAKEVPMESLLQDLSLPIVRPVEEAHFDKKTSKEIVTSFDGVGSSYHSLSHDSYSSCRSCIAEDSSKSCEREGDPSIPQLSNEKKVSGELDSSYRHFDKHEISTAEIIAEPDNDNMDDESSEYAESVITSQTLAVEDILREEELDDENPQHQRKVSTVTFRDLESGDIYEEESVSYESDGFPEKKKAEKNDRRGVCYRCLKGNRFTEKVVCLVCDAKFCRKCVLRAMGSMPEGRKCVTCTGFKICESMRGTLGKSSRMLQQFLTQAQVKEIMSNEVSCAANQLPPQLVSVNEKPLGKDELLQLQSCSNPPKKLMPGSYWYDKVSGLWGKVGEKPCQIITPQLSIGGYLQRDASHGNTKILINNREITKEEVLLLKSAGIPCEGKPHFWVLEDGSYKEEGQRDCKGKLWEKRKTRLVCKILSLPLPPNTKNPEEVAENSFEQSILFKLLLVGFSKSGTSTIFKQAKLSHNVPFSDEERKTMKLIIQSKLYIYLGILLEGRQQFEEEILKGKGKGKLIDEPSTSGRRDQRDKPTYSIGPRLRAFSDWLLKVIASGNLEAMTTSAREYAPLVAQLWKDPSIQNTYNRRNELARLPSLATHFLERAIEISKEDYEPSNIDILYAEGYTTSNRVAFMEFSFPDSEHSERSMYPPYSQQQQISRYQLIRVNPKILGGNCRWLEKFDNIDMVLFCASLMDYDEFVEDSNGVLINKMLASKQLFERIVTYPDFEKKEFLLILNKFDLLEEKIEQVPLTQCEWFHDFNPVISHNPNSNATGNATPTMAQRAFHYIAVKFKRLFHSLTERKLFVSLATGLEPESVNECLRYAREIMKWNEEETTCINEESITSIEASSS